MSSLVYVGRVWLMMPLARWCTGGAGDCVNVCLCQVRICQKVYVIVGMALHKLVLGGLCLFASVKSSVLTLICPLLILQIRLMRGSPIQWQINWVRLNLIWRPNNGDPIGNTEALSSDCSLAPISLVVNVLPATSAVRSRFPKNPAVNAGSYTYVYVLKETELEITLSNIFWLCGFKTHDSRWTTRCCCPLKSPAVRWFCLHHLAGSSITYVSAHEYINKVNTVNNGWFCYHQPSRTTLLK